MMNTRMNTSGSARPSRKVAHELISIGYRALAKELHPDTPHGDRDAMIRLNRVCDKLKHSI